MKVCEIFDGDRELIKKDIRRNKGEALKSLLKAARKKGNPDNKHQLDIKGDGLGNDSDADGDGRPDQMAWMM
jgi:hypothetical protein